jgi:hypothetical protein
MKFTFLVIQSYGLINLIHYSKHESGNLVGKPVICIRQRYSNGSTFVGNKRSYATLNNRAFSFAADDLAC